MSIIIFIVDCLLHLNVGYYEDLVLIMTRKKIISYYLKKEFIYDFIPLIVLII